MRKRNLKASTKSRREQLLESWKGCTESEKTFYAVVDAVQYSLNADWQALGNDAPFRSFLADSSLNKLTLLANKNGTYVWVTDYEQLNAFNEALTEWYAQLKILESQKTKAEKAEAELATQAAMKVLKTKTRKLVKAEQKELTKGIATAKINAANKALVKYHARLDALESVMTKAAGPLAAGKEALITATKAAIEVLAARTILAASIEPESKAKAVMALLAASAAANRSIIAVAETHPVAIKAAETVVKAETSVKSAMKIWKAKAQQVGEIEQQLSAEVVASRYARMHGN